MKDIVITGIGPICAIGADVECFQESLREGESGIFEIEGFDTANYPTKCAGIIDDFDVEEYLPTPKNYLDRNTELSFAAFQLGLEDSGLDLEQMDRSRIALFWSTAYGGTDTMNRFFADVHQKGPRFAKPILFPHTYTNTAISMLSIEYKLDGPHMHFSSGWGASSQAVSYACDLIDSERAELAFVGCSEAFSETLLRYCNAQGILAATGEDYIYQPFSSKASGIVPGEGACMLVLENRESALKRNARIYAEITSCALANASAGWQSTDSQRPIKQSIESALKQAGLTTESISSIISNTCGLKEMDQLEASVLNDMFENANVTGINSMLGETFSCSGIFKVATAAIMLQNGFIAPQKNADNSNVKIRPVVEQAVEADLQNCLISDLDPAGGMSILLMTKLQ